ncbi:MAG TPA: MarR family transcriptional regulator [Acidimicrobiales bacterium]|jgi:DNA-binding MarR family transcriptional regulator|nr:MarR family transcriptional regulator [Acidimicrobiales bacterium]
MAPGALAAGAPSRGTGATGVGLLPASPVADEELTSRLRVAVIRLNRRLRQQSLAGLSPAQASALGTINRLGNPTLGELAVAEQVQPPTVTRLVASMEAAGLVTRLADADDRRVARIRPTAEGRRTLQRMRRLKNAFLTRRLAALDPAEREAAAALVELLEHLVAEQ